MYAGSQVFAHFSYQDARARSAVTQHGWRWIVDSQREGRRYIVHADELLDAFLELQRVTHIFEVGSD